MSKKGTIKKFNEIVSDIKSIKIQGARNVARAALRAYSLLPGKKSIKILLASRPTEPMMARVLKMAQSTPPEKIAAHFDSAQQSINTATFKLIKSKNTILTHCHSTNVTSSLIYSHKKGKKFQVYLTESRPLFQGRKTAQELRKAGIKATMFVDSAINLALSGKEDKKANMVFIGADALLPKGIINKIGSGTIARIAYDEKTPLYIIADSWKFTTARIPIEQRPLNEVWDKAPKSLKIKNPAFEFVPKKLISGIISEYGLLKYDKFVRLMNGKRFNV